MAERIADKLFSMLEYAIQEIGLAWGVKEELEKMKNHVSIIREILLDAQEQQISNHAVEKWLQRLALILYDADDLLDEVATETKRRRVESQNGLVIKVYDFFTSSNSLAFRYVVARKVKNIEKSLDEIVLEMKKFKFLVKQVGRPTETLKREETSFFVNTQTIIGREIDKEKIMSLLLSSGYEEKVPIIPIVGMGGLGKTTLAQLVYNDPTIQNHFAKRVLWVCISDDFNIERILIKILQAGGDGGDNRCDSVGLQQLQIKVSSMLSGDKFLLFLDDVWNEDIVEWKKLENLLITGASGSRIVVTTRNKEVASIVKTGTVISYELGGLSDQQCLEILVKWAFKEGENKHQILIDIGREIVKKCGGVPLAVRTLGAMLRSKRNVSDWKSVRDSEMWALVQNKNDILPILKSSYDQMPSFLKHCFAYCSLFEKDEDIRRERLIYSWMAQGFLQCSDTEKELENIGEGYILELVRRSFLEPVDHWAEPYYKMHDLVHDLAQYVAGNECLTIPGATTKAIPDTVRHVSFNSTTYYGPLSQEEKLRTIFLPEDEMEPKIVSSMKPKIASFKRLRVLDRCRFGDKHFFSESNKIGKLKLLRYLRLDGIYNNLPKSFCKLLNLEYLDLSESMVDELPDDFDKLINLRYLRLSTRLTCLSEREFLRLTSLRTLILFNCRFLRSLGEGIEVLSCLRELVLDYCHKLESLPAGLSYLASLERLVIISCPRINWSDGNNDLKGLKSLEKLKFCYLPNLVTLPKGLLDAAATLTHLEISGCKRFTLPSECILPNLQSLQSLKIKNCPGVRSLLEWMQGLTELQFLSISGCHLDTSRYREGGEDWHKIAHIPTTEIS